MSQDSVTIDGVVESIRFHNAQNGYTIFNVRSGEEPLTVVGTYPFAAVGERVRAVGMQLMHPTYGQQFKAEIITAVLPTEPDDIRLFLQSGPVRGVGEVLSARIVDMFGADTLTVIRDEPFRLLEIKGVTRRKMDEICESLRARLGLSELTQSLSGLGIPPAVITKLYSAFGSSSPEVVQEDPYILCEDMFAMEFYSVDGIAAGLGLRRRDEVRVQAGIKHVLRHNLLNGHMFLPRDKLLAATADMLQIDVDSVEFELETLKEEGALCEQDVGPLTACFLPRMLEIEQDIARRVKALDSNIVTPAEDLGKLIARMESERNLTYAPAQREAIDAALNHGVMVLTGGPGTGKTTTLLAIIEALSACGLTIALCAPTGRAAKRMTELCGMEAKTIHRLLEMDFHDEANPVFTRDGDNPLESDAVIVDEMSMVDAPLMQALLCAVKPAGRIIMVGDCDQLPPVGPGNVLRDLIDSNMIHVIRLTEIFRQAADSLIITNAHLINSGEYPELHSRDRDFFFLGRARTQVAECIVDLCVRRLRLNMGLDPFTDIQVITPQKKGETGTANLNRLLQDALNPERDDKRQRVMGDTVIREGDKVMQTRNNYNLVWIRPTGEMGFGVFNGDVGRVESIDPRAEVCRVMFDDRQVDYSFVDLFELDLAYAITVHKSQGSEFRAVVFPASNGPKPLMCRNVLYTAVTRARELVVMVGDKGVLCTMVDNNRKVRRYTSLKYMLQAGEVDQ